MSCKEKALLEAYVDGQLDLVKSLEIERHLAQCEECAAAVKGHRALQSALGGASLYFEPPSPLAARVSAELRRTATPTRPARTFGWRWLAAAASLPSVAVLAAALLLMVRTPSEGDLLNQDLVSAHVRSLMADHLTDVPSSDQHTVKPWFNGRLDFSPEVKDLSAEGYPLVGGRLDYVRGHATAALAYERRKHVINVFIWPEPKEARATTAPAEAGIRGYNLITWTRAGTRYAAVSDLNVGELREFVKDLQ